MVPGFESIKDQERPLRLLTTSLKKGAIPHALLFTGIDGVGRRTTALALARALNCPAKSREDRPASPLPSDNALTYFSAFSCGECRSCKKIESGNHPDIHSIEREGSRIRIRQIRQLCDTLAMKPYEASVRVVIISDAQQMNREAGNALLKVLEEPPDHTLLVLTAPQPSDLLPTIVSRCQHLRFNPVSTPQIEQLLIDQKGLSPDQAGSLAAISRGSVARALSIEPEKWLKRREWLLGQMEQLPFTPAGIRLAFAENLARKKEWIPEDLEIIQSWFRDLCIARYAPENIINKDRSERIQALSEKMEPARLLEYFAHTQKLRQGLDSNTNLRLNLEIFAMQMESTTGGLP